jgi:hypothetical protein
MPRITDTDLKIGHLLYPEYHSLARPKTRGECPTVRPCPFIGCRYNLYLDVNGDLSANATPWMPNEVYDQPVSNCALDIAEEDGKSLEEIAAILKITRERVRQIIESGLAKMKQQVPYSLHRHLTVVK